MATFHDYLNKLDESKLLLHIHEPVSKQYEIAGILKALEPKPVLFHNLVDSKFQVAGNLLCSKADFAHYFDLNTPQIIPFLSNAIEHPSQSKVIQNAPCQEVVMEKPDLNLLPLLRHCEKDGGNYISSGVFITKHPNFGQNADYHRAMQFSQTEMALRIVRNRHFDLYLQDLKQMDVAICIGNTPNILAAGATSVAIGVNELDIANRMEPFPLIHAMTCDLLIPAECEFVIEGTVYLDRKHAEGPFVDLTETYDVVREEPVMVVKAITHRKDAIWQALLPGALEHKLLMGMPREPTIFRKVNEQVRCLDVNVDPGGSSWLHAIIQIDKQNEDDGKKAIQAAFCGHTSCKHVFVVDRDIDIYDPGQVEWAFATRFQGDRDMVIKDKEQGSSLDPSAESKTALTTKIGFDLTKPLKSEGKSFEKAAFPKVDLQKYLPL